MAIGAYVLLKAEPNKTASVTERLKRVKGLEVHEVLGPYDIIVSIEAATPEDLTAILRSGIRVIPGITDTMTCTWMD